MTPLLSLSLSLSLSNDDDDANDCSATVSVVVLKRGWGRFWLLFRKGSAERERMKKLYERGIFGKKRKKLEFDNFFLEFCNILCFFCWRSFLVLSLRARSVYIYTHKHAHTHARSALKPLVWKGTQKARVFCFFVQKGVWEAHTQLSPSFLALRVSTPLVVRLFLFPFPESVHLKHER